MTTVRVSGVETRTCLLGIDNGSTVTKAAIYDTNGNEIAVSSVKTEMLFPSPGYTEKDMNALWAANVRVISEVLSKAAIDAHDIAGIAVTGHGNGAYLVDADGRPAYNGINSADSRADAYVARWYRDGTFERVLSRTCQSIWAAQPVALLAWFADRMPDVIERTRWVFMCKDFIRFRLTGEANAEVTDYSGTSLMNVREVRYDPRLLESFGISWAADKLPPLCTSSQICGHVTKTAAAETGLREGTPVAGGLFDIDACAISTGITDPGHLCLVAGSWSINEYISAVPIESRDLFMTSAYCIPGYWLILEGSATSASNLEWVVSELMAEETRMARTQGHSVYELCDEMVAAGHGEESEVVFLPFLYGSNAGPNASACFIGLHGWHKKAHLLRAVYEGVVFSHKTHVDRLRAFSGTPRTARIAGGAAKSAVWVQMFADVLGIPIETTANEELGAMGAAMCAGIGVGLFSTWEEAAARMVRIAATVHPRSSAAGIYEEKYARYLRYVKALRSAWSDGQENG
jgi:L-xylulokinase